MAISFRSDETRNRKPFTKKKNMAKESPYLKFTEVAIIGHSDNPKTKRHFHVTNVSRGVVGEIKWYKEWRRYCFFSLAYQGHCIFDEQCLSEINMQLEALNDVHEHQKKERKKNGKSKATDSTAGT